ncbi:CPBP family intramembrane glutamic endopeptidase [Clostridium ganghwense]|uniref:Type II CAAX endopeptidase family protein n=1 Tax=Clostridium ganghwense TaxID=312089 RepID=A0ABT4CRZ9_9CLOT|nr:type II CAAX endopeptidase family protein [Clostridium ganghwense]MCY6371841.1 type II CAAX endopeptidase family protein [Clostridium ganghwense]
MSELTEKDKSGIGIGDIIYIFILYMTIIAGVIESIFLLITKVPYFNTNPTIVPYINLIGEIITKVIVLSLILKKVYDKNLKTLNYKGNFTLTLFICTIGLIGGYFIFAQNSIHLLLRNVKVNEVVEEAFRKLAQNEFVFFTSIVIVAPIYEELLFRKIFLGGMSKRYKKVTALVLSSLIFGAMHLNIPQFVNAFFLGLILGVIYLKTESLTLCMIAHGFNNLIALFISTPEKFNGVGLTIGIIIIIIFAVFFHKETKKNKFGTQSSYSYMVRENHYMDK